MDYRLFMSNGGDKLINLIGLGRR